MKIYSLIMWYQFSLMCKIENCNGNNCKVSWLTNFAGGVFRAQLHQLIISDHLWKWIYFFFKLWTCNFKWSYYSSLCTSGALQRNLSRIQINCFQTFFVNRKYEYRFSRKTEKGGRRYSRLMFNPIYMTPSHNSLLFTGSNLTKPCSLA